MENTRLAKSTFLVLVKRRCIFSKESASEVRQEETFGATLSLSTMSLLVISGFSEVVEWRIPDFISLARDTESIETPTFALAGCTWHLEVYPKGHEKFLAPGRASIRLRLDSTETTDNRVIYTFGLRRADGSLQEDPSFNFNFKPGDAVICVPQRWKLEDLQERESELLPSGALTITLRMANESRTPEALAKEVESQGRTLVDLETLSSDFKDLFISERKCDVTVNVQGKDFKAHRAVLSARSSVFRAMYDHDTAEEETGDLRIPDCDPGTFAYFLNYLYTGKTDEMSFQTAYHLYTTADKYDVQRLKSFCADFLKQNLTVESVCEVVALADRHSDEELMSSAQVFFNKNFRKVLLTSEWKALSSSCPRLSNKLLGEMAASDLENP